MSVHPPKRITSTEGLGAGTKKTIAWLAPDHAVTTEVWPRLKAPWQESGVIIADEGYVWKTEWKVGERFVKTDIYDESGAVVAAYVDICRPVVLRDGVLSFEDMYLDIWQPTGAAPMLLDKDELRQASEQEIITKEEARMATKVATWLLQRGVLS